MWGAGKLIIRSLLLIFHKCKELLLLFVDFIWSARLVSRWKLSETRELRIYDDLEKEEAGCVIDNEEEEVIRREEIIIEETEVVLGKQTKVKERREERREEKREEKRKEEIREEKRRIPKGIPNIGNTCYLNSSLQLLLNNEKFYKRIEEEEKQKGSKVELLPLLKNLPYSKDSSTISRIVEILERFSNKLLRQQHDPLVSFPFLSFYPFC